MFRRWAAIAFLFLLLCSVGTYSGAQAARWVFVPHNCAEWEPVEIEDRTTRILETLGVHRGKTLYCGIDQSDTFTKAETYEAGRDYNQRDDNSYWGEHGNFHGFTAYQVGWLTDGEEGLTGVGPHRIFEFPRQRVRDRNDGGRVLYLKYGRTYDSGVDGGKYEIPRQRSRTLTASSTSGFGSGDAAQAIGAAFVWTPWVEGATFSRGTHGSQTDTLAQASARTAFADSRYSRLEGQREAALDGSIVTASDTDRTGDILTAKTFIGANAECQELGYKRAQSITTIEVVPESEFSNSNDYFTDRAQSGEGQVARYGYRSKLYYEAVCWKP